jgi:DNA ligase-1
MKYSTLTEFYTKLDSTSKRLEMIDILINLFKQAPKDEIQSIIYLTSGKIGADYEEYDLGIADKMVIKAIAKSVGRSETEAEKLFVKYGDLGEVIEEMKKKTAQQSLDAFFGQSEVTSSLTIREVWETVKKITTIKGSGANSRKINAILELYSKCTPIEAKYLTRTVLGQLRFGVKDLTIIEALTRAFGEKKEDREFIEHVYNITSDIGYVGSVLVNKGMDAIKSINIIVGRPIRMMAAQRMPTIKEILDKLGGQCALEFKYDGERVQAHITKNEVRLFSRNLNDTSEMFPDVQKILSENLLANEAIVEGEIVAWDVDNTKMLSFQTLRQRKRKYDIEEVMKQIPVKVFLFDILFKDGESLMKKSYPKRRAILETMIKEHAFLAPSTQAVVKTSNKFEEFFEYAIENGCEGVMAKDIREETPYQAGNRGFLWIKHKFDYTTGFADSYDFVIVGGFYGKGKRTGTIGTVLMAAYNPVEERYETVCKLGSGFSDEDLITLTDELMKIKVDKKPKDVLSKMEADIWFLPIKVLEVRGADLSTSPIHTCALDEIKKENGIAIRFPRFVRYRDDKNAELATTTNEVIEAYRNQILVKQESK